MATMHDRYTIDDECCGMVDTRTSLKKALARAEEHAAKHGSQPDNTITAVTVFDRMARRDCQREWTVTVPHAQAATPLTIA